MESNVKTPPAQSFALDLEVLRQFRVIFKSVRRHFQSIEQSLGISGAQLWAVSAIHEQPGLRVTQLAQAMSVHQTTASNLVERLVELGYVTRQRSTTDNRAIELYVTKTGLERLNAAPGPVRGLLPDALDRLSPHTLQSLHHDLSILLEQMERIEPLGKETPLADI